MALDQISLARLAEVHPELSRRVQALDVALEAEGFTMRVTQGVRTVSEQDALYAQGRTDPGPRVTNAGGCNSNHVLGFAVDQCLMRDGVPVWNPAEAAYLRQVALAGSYGLRSGHEWGDTPHLELADVPPKPSGELQQIYINAGIEAVWKEASIPVWT